MMTMAQGSETSRREDLPWGVASLPEEPLSFLLFTSLLPVTLERGFDALTVCVERE
jgi:hypothetical protein